jgi:hypothetical protein
LKAPRPDEDEVDDAGEELDGVGTAVRAGAEGCGRAITPVTGWMDCAPWTRLHAVKDTAAATNVAKAALLPRSFMANV